MDAEYTLLSSTGSLSHMGLSSSAIGKSSSSPLEYTADGGGGVHQRLVTGQCLLGMAGLWNISG